MLVKLTILGLLLGLTFTFCGNIRHPGIKMLLSTTGALGLISLSYFDMRFLLVICVLPLFDVIRTKSKIAAVLLGLSITMAVVTYATPHAADLLYLDLRYSDKFTFVTDGIYHAEYLDEDILVDRKAGDTYQSYYYEPYAIAITKKYLPQGTSVYEAFMSKTQTTYLALSFSDYVRNMAPTIFMRVKIPEDREFNPNILPFTTILELE